MSSLSFTTPSRSTVRSAGFHQAPVMKSSRVRWICSGLNRLAVVPAVAAAAMLLASTASAQLFTSTTSTGNWLNTTGTAGRWSPTSSGPFDGNFVSGSSASFTTAGTYTFDRLVTTGTATLGNITTGSSVNIGFTTSSAQTLNFGGAGGAVGTLDFGGGSVVDFGSIAIKDANGIIKNGAGTLALSGGAYTGGFTLNAGNVIARAANAFGTGALTINGGAIGSTTNFTSPVARTGGITVGGDFQMGIVDSPASSTANMTFAGAGNAINLGNATRTITLGNSGSMTFGSVVSNGGLALASNVNGASGQFSLTGTNTFAGGLTLDGVTLNASGLSNAALGAGNVTLTGITGATLNIRSALTLANNFTIADTAGSKTITNFGANATISGTITNLANTGGLQIGAGAGRVLTLANGIAGSGTSTLVFGGTSAGGALSGGVVIYGAGTYAGNTTIDSSKVTLGADDALSQTNLNLSGNGVLELAGFTQSFKQLSGDATSKVQSLNAGGILAVGAGNATSTFDGAIVSGANLSLVKNGTGSFTLTNAGNTFIGGVTVNDGDLIVTTESLKSQTVALTAPTSTLTLDQATNGIFADVISGAGSLVKSGSGTVTLDAVNTYTGSTTISGGGLVGTTDSIKGNIALSNASSVTFNQETNATASNTISGNGSLTLAGTAEILLIGTNTYSGGTTVSAGKLIGAAGVGIQGTIVNDAEVVFFGSGTYAGNMSGAGLMTKIGAGDLLLTGSSSYAGGTSLNQGTLVGTSDSLFGTITAAGGTNVKFAQTGTGTFLGEVVGAGGVIKEGTGSVALEGNQFYTGATVISAGTLLLSGDQATSGITVASGATLGGTSNLGGSANIDVNGKINPGVAAVPGSLEAAGITLGSTSETTVSLVSDGSGGPGAAGFDYDTVIARNNLAFNGGNLVIRFENGLLYDSFSSFDLFTANSFTAATTVGVGAGFAGITATGSGPYSTLTFSYSPADLATPGRWLSTEATGTGGQYFVFLPSTGKLVIVPEPSTWAMTLASVGFAGWMARRKKLARKRRMA